MQATQRGIERRRQSRVEALGWWHIGGEIAFIHRALMNVWKSRRSKRLTLQEKWREGMRELWKGNGVKTWWGKARHDKVLNRMSLFALRSWLQPALSPCVLVREESWIEKAECGDAGKIEGSRRVRQREERGQIWVLTQLKAHWRLTAVDQPSNAVQYAAHSQCRLRPCFTLIAWFVFF